MDADRPEEIDFVFVSCFSVTSFISFFFFWNNISLSLLIINYTNLFLDFLIKKKKKKKRYFWTFPWRWKCMKGTSITFPKVNPGSSDVERTQHVNFLLTHTIIVGFNILIMSTLFFPACHFCSHFVIHYIFRHYELHFVPKTKSCIHDVMSLAH